MYCMPQAIVNIISSPETLLQVSLCRGLLSIIRPSLASHIFDISPRIVSRIELNLMGGIEGNGDLENCSISI